MITFRQTYILKQNFLAYFLEFGVAAWLLLGRSLSQLIYLWIHIFEGYMKEPMKWLQSLLMHQNSAHHHAHHQC